MDVESILIFNLVSNKNSTFFGCSSDLWQRNDDAIGPLYPVKNPYSVYDVMYWEKVWRLSTTLHEHCKDLDAQACL